MNRVSTVHKMGLQDERKWKKFHLENPQRQLSVQSESYG